MDLHSLRLFRHERMDTVTSTMKNQCTQFAVWGAFLVMAGALHAQQPAANQELLQNPTTNPSPRVWTAQDLFRRNIGTPASQRTPFPPHKIVGNIYYVGTESLSSFLIVTPAGHILIDSTYESNVPGIKDSVEKLGFKFSEIKIVLGNHAHGDHQEGDSMVAETTGAKVMAMAEDIPALQSMRSPSGKARPVYEVLHDGDEVKLGGMTLRAHLTPGHTHGCTTWTTRAQEAGKTFDVAIIGSMGINNSTTRMWENGALTPLGEEYTRGFKAMHAIRADVVLGSHPAMHGMQEKYAKLTEPQAGPNGGAATNPYIDLNGYDTELSLEEGAFIQILEAQQKQSPP